MKRNSEWRHIAAIVGVAGVLLSGIVLGAIDRNSALYQRSVQWFENLPTEDRAIFALCLMLLIVFFVGYLVILRLDVRIRRLEIRKAEKSIPERRP